MEAQLWHSACSMASKKPAASNKKTKRTLHGGCHVQPQKAFLTLANKHCAEWLKGITVHCVCCHCTVEFYDIKGHLNLFLTNIIIININKKGSQKNY